MASIVTFFYLLSIISYIKLRRQPIGYKTLLYGALFIGSIVGGFHAKQNYAGVLLFLFGWELMTCSVKLRRFWLASTAVAFVVLLVISPFIMDFWRSLDAFTRGPSSGSRGEYFYTQLIVLWDYVARFFYPFSLQLNIDTQLRTSMEPLVGLAFLTHILVLAGAFKLRKKIPLLFVGVMLFYTSHMVESLLIPILDLAFEHRTYIGNIGLVLAVVGLLQFWSNTSDNTKLSKRFAFGICLVLLGSSWATFERNTLWQNPFDFYANEVRLAPEQARANASYGSELMKLDRLEEAAAHLKKSVDRSLLENKITASGLTSYMTVLYQQKKYQQAAKVAMVGLKYIKEPLERSALLGNLAFGYIQMGYCDFATGLLTKALELDSGNASAQSNLKHCQSTAKGGKTR